VSDAASDPAWQEGRARWPGIRLEREVFERFLVERGPVSGLHGADLYLACACAEGDAAALLVFERDLMSQVPLFLSRLPAPTVQEVQQLLRERLLVSGPGKRAQIADYAGRGPLAGWLRIAALRAAGNLRRDGQVREAHEELSPATPAIGADPELAFLKGHYRPAFERAFGEAFQTLTVEERNVLRLHFLDGLNIDRIGALFQVHRATAARWLASARERLMEETRRKAQAALGISPAELDSLLGLVRSQLGVSLHSFFRER
jgi:RNA polymerase sigma-70 factor (ECF subfamily)